jgi:hypothetical protein
LSQLGLHSFQGIIHVAHLYEEMQHGEEVGITVSEMFKLIWPKLKNGKHPWFQKVGPVSDKLSKVTAEKSFLEMQPLYHPKSRRSCFAKSKKPKLNLIKPS